MTLPRPPQAPPLPLPLPPQGKGNRPTRNRPQRPTAPRPAGPSGHRYRHPDSAKLRPMPPRPATARPWPSPAQARQSPPPPAKAPRHTHFPILANARAAAERPFPLPHRQSTANLTSTGPNAPRTPHRQWTVSPTSTGPNVPRTPCAALAPKSQSHPRPALPQPRQRRAKRPLPCHPTAPRHTLAPPLPEHWRGNPDIPLRPAATPQIGTVPPSHPRHPPASTHLHHGSLPMPLTTPLPKSRHNTTLVPCRAALPSFTAGRAGAFVTLSRAAPEADAMAPATRPPARTSITAACPWS